LVRREQAAGKQTCHDPRQAPEGHRSC